MKTFKEYVENPLNEATKSDFTAGYEESQFGGYRALVRNQAGKVSYLGQTAYKTPEAAKGEAEVYIKADGESGGNDRKIMGAVTQYQKQNKGALREDKQEMNEAVVRNSNNELRLKAGSSELHITTKGNNVNIFIEEGGGETMFAGKADDLKALKEFFSKL